MTCQVIRFPRAPVREPYLPKHLLARHLGYSESWIDKRCREGMPSHMVGGKRKFRLSEVDGYLSAKEA